MKYPFNTWFTLLISTNTFFRAARSKFGSSIISGSLLRSLKFIPFRLFSHGFPGSIFVEGWGSDLYFSWQGRKSLVSIKRIAVACPSIIAYQMYFPIIGYNRSPPDAVGNPDQ